MAPVSVTFARPWPAGAGQNNIAFVYGGGMFEFTRNRLPLS